MSQGLISKANILRDSGQPTASRRILLPLLKSKDFRIAVNAYDSLGLGYMNEKEYTKALECFKSGLKLAEDGGWFERLSGIARDIAIAYKNAKKYQQAEKWFLTAIEYVRKYNDEGPPTLRSGQAGGNASLGITYSKLGLLYTDMKLYRKAQLVFAKALPLLNKSKHDYWKLIGNIDRCNLLYQTKKYREAQKWLEYAITDALAQDKEYKLIEALLLAGDTELKLKNKLKAQQCFLWVKEVLKISDSPRLTKKFEGELKKRIG
ncbi:tetratricopeptide repeat protein [Candidatus Microgenomates bacterium]|nr:tetratricopeptide repeat protein [Candidatus Microgenomates bacterium]